MLKIYGAKKLSAQQSFLAKAQSFSTILSAIAIPVVLAFSGYAVQQSIAEDGIKRDYLTLAVGMLKNDVEKLDPELRQWASAVVAKYSPVPFDGSAEKLGRALALWPSIPLLPDVARQKDAGDICNPGCSSALTEKLSGWRLMLSEAKNERAAENLKEVLDQSVRLNQELAAALDASKIAGSACSKIYDSLRNAPI